MDHQGQKIAFQGELGAYSHQACREVFPDAEVLPCKTFEGAVDCVRKGLAGYAVLPVENSTYGRVADIHQLLPHSGLHLIAEHFVRVNINLFALPGVTLSDITEAQSHTVLLGQCRKFLTGHNIAPVTGADTAGSARDLADGGPRHRGALASRLAGEIYGLDLIAEHIEDNHDNTTRFVVMAPEPVVPSLDNGPVITSFVFRVRNIPAALYKAMGGFATNGVNMVKLESYMVGGSFTATQFYADIEGHRDAPAVRRALEELGFFTDYLEILGVYPAHEARGLSTNSDAQS